MNTQEKLTFIDSLTRAVAEDIKAKITAGKIPDEWDGHELRVLLSEKFAYEAARTLGRDGVIGPRTARLKAYRSTIVNANL